MCWRPASARMSPTSRPLPPLTTASGAGRHPREAITRSPRDLAEQPVVGIGVGEVPRVGEPDMSRLGACGKRRWMPGSRADYARRSGARIDVLARNAPVRGERKHVYALPFEPATIVGTRGTRGPLTDSEVIAAAQRAALEAQR